MRNTPSNFSLDDWLACIAYARDVCARYSEITGYDIRFVTYSVYGDAWGIEVQRYNAYGLMQHNVAVTDIHTEQEQLKDDIDRCVQRVCDNPLNSYAVSSSNRVIRHVHLL